MKNNLANKEDLKTHSEKKVINKDPEMIQIIKVGTQNCYFKYILHAQ